MKVLHVIDQIGLEHGGSAAVARQLTGALTRRGHDITVYSSDAGTNGFTPNLRKFKTVASIKDSLRFTPAMFFADYKFDVIHCHNYYTFQNMFARMRNVDVPMVLQPHGTFIMYDGIIQRRMIQKLIDGPWRKWFLERMDKVICVSTIEINQAVLLGLELISLVPNGINLDEYNDLPAYGEFRDKYKFDDSDKIILYVGRHHWMKGLDNLFNTYKWIENKNKRLVVIGAEHYSEYDGVLELPPMYGRDKLSAMVDADVYVLPSNYDVFGIAPLEAMACGTPAIITNRCGLACYCSGKPGQPIVSLIDKLSLCIEHELRGSTKELYRNERRQFVEQYDWDNIAEKMEGVYRDVVK